MKAIVAGDNLISSEMILSRAGPLRDAGYAIQSFDWMFADRNEMNRRNLSQPGSCTNTSTDTRDQRLS